MTYYFKLKQDKQTWKNKIEAKFENLKNENDFSLKLD